MRNKIKIVSISLLFFALASPAFSASLLTEHFNSFTDGSINGQNLWTSYGTDCEIQDTIAFEYKAVKCNAGVSGVEYDNVVGVNSTQHIYIYSPASNNNIRYKFMSAGRADQIITIRWAGSDIYYTDATSVEITLGTGVSAGSWHDLQIEWKDDYTAKYQIDTQGWTGYITTQTNNTPELFAVDNVDGGSGTTYFDYLDENAGTYIPPTPPPTPTGGIINATTGDVNGMLAYAGQLFGDLGIWIWVVVGVIVGFYMAEKFVAMLVELEKKHNKYDR